MTNMNADEKPFACTADGCGMRFTNEDHLAVHKKKHEMCLSLGGASKPIIVDQTPTPTRFIRNCEEVGLFQDLPSVNPFDEQFRKAVQQNNSIDSTDCLSVPSTDDTLNTPSVCTASLHPTVPVLLVTPSQSHNDDHNRPVIGSSDHSLSSIIVSSKKVIASSEPSNDCSISNSSTLSSSALTVLVAPPITSSTSCFPVPAITCNNEDVDLCHVPIEHFLESNKPLRETSDVHCGPAITPPVIHIPDTQNINPHLFTIQNENSVYKNIQVVNPKSMSRIEVLNKVTRPLDIAPAINVKNEPSGANIVIPQHSLDNVQAQINPKMGSVQYIIKVNGADIPVSIPSITSANIPTVVALAENDNPVMDTKQKLKQVLVQNQTPAKCPRTSSAESLSSNSGANTLNNSSQVVASNRVRRKSSEEDPEERRQKFLERNRAAATRCRLKRKGWVDSLEEKAQQLQTKNNHLQNEVTSLRNEVSYLKSMLLAHKDCPVTLQQIEEQNSGNVVQSNVIQSTSNVQKTLNADGSSNQSTYFVSITSDETKQDSTEHCQLVLTESFS